MGFSIGSNYLKTQNVNVENDFQYSFKNLKSTLYCALYAIKKPLEFFSWGKSSVDVKTSEVKDRYLSLKILADQGCADAQFNLAVMYDEGRGVAQSDTEAFRNYKLAADQGGADAQFNLAIMYESGRGVAQSDTEAFRNYKLAADQGNVGAQLKLGLMHETGRGVEKSNEEA